MNSLRVLLVERDPSECERISDLLQSARHDVLPLNAVGEALEALDLQRFDAVLVASDSGDEELAALSAKLRFLEQSSRVDGHVPIVARGEARNKIAKAVEAYLPGPFQPGTFLETVRRLTHAGAAPATGELSESIPVFDTDAFKEQVYFEKELMAEIIDLYLEESAKQRAQMRELLDNRELLQLSRVAHTIKGSLSSLHAQRARQRAQELEIAAKAGQFEACVAAHTYLERELSALVPELDTFRSSL